MLKTASIVILNNLNSINQENQIKIRGKYKISVTGIAVIGSIGTAIAASVPITDVVQLVKCRGTCSIYYCFICCNNIKKNTARHSTTF